MPLLSIRVSSKTFEEITRLVQQGQYSGLDQFVEVAALNQLALERGATPEELRARERRDPHPAPKLDHTMSQSRERSEPLEQPLRSRSEDPRLRTTIVHQRRSPRSAISEAQAAILKAHVSFPQSPAGGTPRFLEIRARPDGERLWGQVNRLFALKFVVRWLAVAARVHAAWPRIDVSGPGTTEDAATLGSILERADHAAGRKRDELFSTGLPRRGNPASMDRFQSQYIARTTRSGEIYPGAVCQYALADFDGDQLGLTEAGMELAKLENPLLDGDWNSAPSALSETERRVFQAVVRDWVPGECRDFQMVMSAVGEGSDSPESLLETLRQQLPNAWTDVQRRTHVSGVVARMIELDLLKREWEGRRVRYEVGTLQQFPRVEVQ